MRISGDDDRVSGGVDNARVVAFVRPRYIDNTQRPGSRIHFIVPSFWLKKLLQDTRLQSPLSAKELSADTTTYRITYTKFLVLHFPVLRFQKKQFWVYTQNLIDCSMYPRQPFHEFHRDLSIIHNFWATVCKTVHPTLSDRCHVCLSVCL